MLLLLAACTSSEQAGAAAGPQSRPLSPPVATVNGVTITELDVQLAQKPSSHSKEPAGPEKRKAIVAGLVREELFRQKAGELGLVPEGPLADEVARLEALLNAARRKAQADAYFRVEISKKAEPSEQEARKFFDDNAALIRTQWQVSQILLRDEGQMNAVLGELQSGASFEAVARRQFPELPPEAGLPWELGFLSWKQLPEFWRPVLETLKAGETSPVIRGPGGRLWILKLVERRPQPEVTFEEVRPLIVEDLKRGRIEQLTAQAEQSLRKSARITMTEP